MNGTYSKVSVARQNSCWLPCLIVPQEDGVIFARGQQVFKILAHFNLAH